MRPLHLRKARYANPVLIPLLAMCLSSCATSSQDVPVQGSLQQTLKVLAEKHRVCAVAVAVIKNRQLDTIDSATGCQPATQAGPDSVFQAASLSKPVFAYAVLKLARQGKLSLDTPLVAYLPHGYRHQFDPLQAQPSELVTDSRLQAVTARMVLNHTSGLPNWASGPLYFEAAPGTRWSYSGEGYLLLQRAVEAATGQPLDQWMASQVFEPFGMRHSAYVWNERFAPDILPGNKANGQPRTSLDLKAPVAAFSLYTSAADYGKFLVNVLNDEAAIRDLTASPVTVDAGLQLDWGLGWGIERHQDDSYIWQWGNNTGYRAFVIASVGTGDGFVILTNSENGLKLAQPLTQKLLPGKHTLFQSPLLGDDVINLLCNTVRLCL